MIIGWPLFGALALPTAASLLVLHLIGKLMDAAHAPYDTPRVRAYSTLYSIVMAPIYVALTLANGGDSLHSDFRRRALS